MISTFQPLDQRLSVARLAPVSQLISNCHPLVKHLSAALSAPISCLISACQHVDQHLSAASLATVSCLISTCKPLKQCVPAASSVPVSCLFIAFSAARSAPTQPRDHSLSASLSESVIHLISTCQQVEECLLSRANCISQPVDLHLLSPASSTYSAARSVPVSRLRSTFQPVDQHLSAS